MKKKVLKILAAIGILLYIIGFIFVTKIIVDNTVSKSEAKDIAVKYIANKYKGKDYYIDVIDSYNPKEGYYSVHVKSKSSKDSYFYLEIQLDGKIRRDTYIDHVKERGNTASRISDDYDRLIEKTFNKKNIPFKRCGAYGEIKYMSKEDKEHFLKSYNEIETKDAYDEMCDESYYLVSDELELDKKYDIKKIGKESGRITITIIDKKVSVKKAAEYLLRIKDFLDKEDVPFYAIDLWLQYSEKDDEISASKNIYIENFFYKDIEEKGLEKRIKRRIEANK